jgi:predicted O-linked N-acetylglucosamine transferase (SPINDLY family)
MISLRPAPRHDRHAARVALSLLTNAGFPELVARDPDDFVRTASALARNREQLAALHARARSQFLASVVCDGPAFGARLGSALRGMWRERCCAAATR